jgi:RND family efflux transporter MFP subunit
MKKLFILAAASIVLFSCQPKQQSAEDIRKQINAYKMEITELENSIQELQTILDQDTSLSNSEFTVLVNALEMQQDTFMHFVEITGNVESEFQSNISPEMSGQIKSILVEEGQRVSKGELLVLLKSDVTESGIQELKKSLELATTMYNKQKSLWDQNIGSEVQYLQAKNSKESLEKSLATLEAQLEMTKIRAPYAGIVDEIFAKKGEMATPGYQVLQLVNLKSLQIEADISEYYIPYLKKGDLVSVSFPTYPDMILDNVRIIRIGNIINPNNRTVKIQLTIPNPDEKLKPNMLCKVKVQDFVNNAALTLPTITIKKDADQNNYIYVVAEEDGRLISKKRKVVIGKSYGNTTEIVEGLQAGDRVITEGYNLVKNGTAIRLQ